LYHDAKIKYRNTSKTIDAINDIQKFIRKNTCLIHHHTDIKINNYFDETPSYATIVRDPYDRFISDITHLARHARSNPDPSVIIGGDSEINRAISDPSIDIYSLIDICSSSASYQNFYRNWFGNLFLGRNGLGGDEYIKDIYDPLFPVYIRGVIKNISSFTNIETAFDDISKLFELPRNNEKLNNINKKLGDDKVENMRSKYLHLFEKDYNFLKKIGHSFQKE
jgi:hypothetical protein